LMTAVLGVFMVYFFAIVAFFFLPQDFYNEDTGEDDCRTMITCFTTFMHRGLLYGGGIGDYMTGDLGSSPIKSNNNYYETGSVIFRTIYDLMYFILVLVLLLNIIFGIILDTFSALREDTAEKLSIMKNSCFICGLDKVDFDDAAQKRNEQKGFVKHTKEEHNMWDYLFFLVYLDNKDSTEYTGAETYVNECVQNEDIAWIPTRRAMALEFDNSADEEADAIGNLKKELSRQTNSILGRINDLDARIGS